MLTKISDISREAPVLIAGPTASGKSALAMALAARDGRVVVNGDALQVYDCWRILSARPSSADELAQPHALYGHIAREQAYSVGHWLREVSALLNRPVVIVGGTGLYFRALTEGLAEIPPIPAQVRKEGDALFASDLASMIAGLDRATSERIDLANGARVQRAWEVLRATGRGLADWQADTPAPILPLGDTDPIVMRPDVPWLNARIDARFDEMMKMGVLNEVRAALPDWNPALPSSRAIGARELVDHLRGDIALDVAIAAAKQASRAYAKRQRTWFRARMGAWNEIAQP